MHAILSYDHPDATLIEIVYRDPVTGVEAVIERHRADFDFSRKDMVHAQLAEKTHDLLKHCGYRTTGVWQLKDGIGKVSLEQIPPQSAPTEADTMLTVSKGLGLRALQTLDKARAEASVGNRDYTKNHAYMKARAALDAHCEQLAHLMWTHKHHGTGDGIVGEYPSAHEAEKYLRSVVDKAEEYVQAYVPKKEQA